MTFIALLIAYVLQRKLDLKTSLWLEQRVLRLTRGSIAHLSVSALAASMLVVGLVTGWSRLQLGSSFWGAGALLFDLVGLLLTLGYAGFESRLQAYSDTWDRGDIQGASERARDVLGHYPQAGSARDLQRQVCESMLYIRFSHYFSIIFWFLVAGVAGALVTRLAVILARPDSPCRESGKQLLQFIEFVPARVLAFTFALAGDFKGLVDSASGWLNHPQMPAARVIQRAADGALQKYSLTAEAPEGVSTAGLVRHGALAMAALRELLSRSMGIWIALVAVFEIAGWLS